MAELRDRLKHESELKKVLLQLTTEHAARLKAYLDAGTPLEEIPQEFWDEMRRDIERDDDRKAFLLWLIFSASATQHLKTIPKVKASPDELLPSLISQTGAMGQRYVAKRLKQISGPYIRWTKKLLKTAIRERNVSPNEVSGIPGTSAQNRDRLLPPRDAEGQAWVKDTLDKMFGKNRVDRIADTESNLSMIDGGNAAVKKSGILVAKIWAHSKLRPERHSNAPGKKCPVCSPLEGKIESEWGGNEPGKIHPNCDCFPLMIDEYGNIVGDDGDSDTLERFRDRLPPGFLKDREQLFRDFPGLLNESIGVSVNV